MRYKKLLPILLGLGIIIAYFIWKSELWDVNRLTSRYSQYARGGNYAGTNPHLSPDGGAIVFSTPNTGRGDIYTVNAATRERVRLTNSEDYEGEPSYSPDGKRIVYVREDAQALLHIWVMGADGKNQRQLTSGESDDSHPTFAGNGGIIFTRHDKKPEGGILWHLYSMTLAKTEINLLTPLKTNEDFASCNRDGERRLYFSDKHPAGFWIVNKNSKPVFVGEGGLSTRISSDGANIVFIRNNIDKPRELCVMRWDGSSIKTVCETPDYINNCSFSRDNTKIVFERTPYGSKVGEIVLFDIATRKEITTYPVKP